MPLQREDFVVLTGFSVSNFKNFGRKTELDLVCRGDRGRVPFTDQGDAVKKAILSGGCGSGKTNLSLALFDITRHLTDGRRALGGCEPYLNVHSGIPFAEFVYSFKYEGTRVVYKYAKSNPDTLLYETVTMNGRVVLRYNFSSHEGSAEMAGREFDLSGYGDSVSRVKALTKEVSHINTPEIKAFTSIVEYVDRMLLLDPVLDDVCCGLSVPGGDCISGIASRGNVGRFRDFLRDFGLRYDCEFVTEVSDGVTDLFCRFGTDEVPFRRLASKGELALAALFYWLNKLDNEVSLLYIDDFDSLYSRDKAREIADLLRQETKCQIMLTTHDDFERFGPLREDYCFYDITDGIIIRI